MFNGYNRKNGALRNKTQDLMSNSGGNGGGSNGTVDSMARSSQISPISHKKIPRNLNDKLSGT